MKYLFGKLKAFKLQPSPLRDVKITEIPEVASAVKFFFAVPDANRFSTESVF